MRFLALLTAPCVQAAWLVADTEEQAQKMVERGSYDVGSRWQPVEAPRLSQLVPVDEGRAGS